MDTMKQVLVTVIVAVITGIGSSYVNIAVMETKFVYVDRDIQTFLEAIRTINANHTELVARKQWMKAIEDRLVKVEGYKLP